jgi:hypothetical protein
VCLCVCLCVHGLRAQVAALAREQVMTEVRVDGPYGRPGTFSDKRALVLVAGGIGITPMHSIFAELYAVAARAKSGSCGAVERVVLLWSGRSDVTFCLFAPTFHAVNQRNPNGAFEFYLHNTAPSGGGGGGGGGVGGAAGGVEGAAGHRGHTHSAAGAAGAEVYMGDIPHDALVFTKSIIRRGRAPLAEKLKEMGQLYAPDEVMVMACGPEPLILSASELAFQHGFHFHTEVFHF